MRIFGLFVFFVMAATLLAACSSVDLLNITIPSSGYRIYKDIPYAEGARHTLDIYVPDHIAAGNPVIFFSYGGGWKAGKKEDYLFVGQALASRGFIAVIADYRLYPEIYYPGFMKDVAAAFVWTHKHIAEYGGNTDNLFAAGHSAGAYNVVMLALDTAFMKEVDGRPEWIKAVVGLSGPYDFLPLTDPTLIDMFGGDDVISTQPIHYARRHAPPMLLLTGDADKDVDPRNSYHLAVKLRSLGDYVEQKTYPGIAHIGIVLSLADGFRDKATALQDLADFLNARTVPTGKP